MIQWNGVYVLWMREIKRFLRSKSRIVSSISMPLLMLVSLGMGFRKMNISGVDYISFLAPGLISFSIMTSSIMGGLSVLWDREFGFLKEIMVSPVSRVTIVIGRMFGGGTISLFRGLIIFLLSLPFGFKIGLASVIPFVCVMALISMLFMGFGLLLASVVKDIQGFNAIMTLINMPLFFMSGTFYPISNLPPVLQAVSFADPLTYGVDALRNISSGISIFSLGVDILVLLSIGGFLVALSTYLFNRSESA